MANVTGKDSTKNRSLVVTTYPNAVTQDGKSIYLDVELDVRDERTGAQTNPHLYTTKTSVEGVEGEKYSHARPYSMSQFQQIMDVADHQTIVNPETGNAREVYTLNADIFPPHKGDYVKDENGKSTETAKESTRTFNGVETKTTDFKGKRISERQTEAGVEKRESSGFIINTKKMSEPTFEVDKDIVERQFQATADARAQRDAAKAEKAAPEAAAPEAPAAEEKAPAIDATALQAALEANQGKSREAEQAGPQL